MTGYLKHIANRERLLMLCRMVEGKASVGELVKLSGLTQSGVSQHLARLRADGIVSCEAQAQTRYYHVSDPQMRAIIAALCEICSDTDRHARPHCIGQLAGADGEA